MWVDESGGTDTEAGSTDAVTVHVDGEEYQAELNYDLDKDGVNDAAVIQHDDGTGQAFVDTDGDGDADQYAVLDENGKVVQEAVYDEASGAWVEAGGGGHDDGSDAGTSGTMHADMPSGDVEVGPPTIDTDGDGTPDTAVIQTEDGRTIAFTDKDGDGKADIAVETDASGNSKTYEHTGPGQWTETGSGVVNEDIGSAFASTPAAAEGDPAGDAAWGGAGTETLEGVAKIDSGTGQWISQN
ncbi:DUF6802 family protein [Amycolatopsis azurea]|uniref:DUF6802 domain-containing protein n=1 Tax=Amycolatopsis azurea DSM 43854 TaxID=1238180 RepID=M2PSJ2_9PSEU|nr:DUF6802 family protein [Amycolatopsis azurea]EMD22475.1 hypothetical protein C791_8434 [Amycolatopsis azurea DSM 43854]OOC00897.1 hypothetical protein B0293_40565 [Amycolatopsis azurea DSM 43854]